jgi:hypothetical protein
VKGKRPLNEVSHMVFDPASVRSGLESATSPASIPSGSRKPAVS